VTLNVGFSSLISLSLACARVGRDCRAGLLGVEVVQFA
jgi:hypothetical protein